MEYVQGTRQPYGFVKYDAAHGCGENLGRVFTETLDKSMMRWYNKAVDEDDPEVPPIGEDEYEMWSKLVKAGGDTKRYSDWLVMEECTYRIRDLIYDLSDQHNLCSHRLTYHVFWKLDGDISKDVEEGRDRRRAA